jgi:hypothetical protein
MARTNITTGEQTVTATGAITGTLDTSGLSGNYYIALRVRGLVGGSIQIVLEDTTNATPFATLSQPWSYTFTTSSSIDGVEAGVNSYLIPLASFGVANSKFRFNTQKITASTCFVLGELVQ